MSFILETPRGQRGVSEVIKKTDSWGYMKSYIKIRNKSTWYGITIRDITHNPRERNKIKKKSNL